MSYWSTRAGICLNLGKVFFRKDGAVHKGITNDELFFVRLNQFKKSMKLTTSSFHLSYSSLRRSSDFESAEAVIIFYTTSTPWWSIPKIIFFIYQKRYGGSFLAKRWKDTHKLNHKTPANLTVIDLALIDSWSRLPFPLEREDLQALVLTIFMIWHDGIENGEIFILPWERNCQLLQT